jgi:small subunit ribosomal protein S6
MPATEPTYDLVLMLDTSVDANRRSKILADTRATVQASGKVTNEQDWGARSLAFEIDKKTDAEYHLLQFNGTPELLRGLTRTLRITDGVLRHRIIKLAPGTPDVPDLRPERAPVAVAAPAEPAPAEPDEPSAPAEPAQAEADEPSAPAEPAQAEADEPSAPAEPAQAEADEPSAPAAEAPADLADAPDAEPVGAAASPDA